MSSLHEDIEKWRVDCLTAVQNAIQQENSILRARMAALVGKTFHFKEWRAVPVPVEIVGLSEAVGYSTWAQSVDYEEWEAQSGVDTSLLVRALPGWSPSEEAIEAEVAKTQVKTKRTREKYAKEIRDRSLAIAKRFATPQETNISFLS